MKKYNLIFTANSVRDKLAVAHYIEMVGDPIMKRHVTEKWLLKKMDIPDWRHMSKDKITTFVSSLPYMDPEVAKAAIDQFENFSDLAKEMLNQLTQNISSSIQSEEKISLSTLDFLNQTRDSLFKQLDNENISEKERASIRDNILDLSKMAVDLNKQHQNFLLKNVFIVATTISAVAVAAAGILGINAKSEPLSIDSNDDMEDRSD